MNQNIRIVFTQGGKGGVGKTELVLSLISWYHQQDIRPVLLDFDVENTHKSGLQNFYPEARKFDVHREGALDELFDICDRESARMVVADMGAGAGEATYAWFDHAFEDARDLHLEFTAIAVTTNDAGAVQSVLKWASHLQNRVDYLVVLNEFREPRSDFEYWNDEPAVKRYVEAFEPHIITMGARIQEFQAELRNQCVTMQDVIEGQTQAPFLRKTKNVVRARRYQRQLFEGFEAATSKLL